MSLFGSAARGEQTENSDVDVLVDMPATLRGVGGANDYLENLLGCHVDMVRNHKHLTPFFRKQIERDGSLSFENLELVRENLLNIRKSIPQTASGDTLVGCDVNAQPYSSWVFRFG